MDVFTMVVVIVVITMTAGVINHYIKARTKMTDPGELEDIHKRLERMEKLEERVRTLEKIVTDKKTKLADEIDRL